MSSIKQNLRSPLKQWPNNAVTRRYIMINCGTKEERAKMDTKFLYKFKLNFKKSVYFWVNLFICLDVTLVSISCLALAHSCTHTFMLPFTHFISFSVDFEFTLILTFCNTLWRWINSIKVNLLWVFRTKKKVKNTICFIIDGQTFR